VKAPIKTWTPTKYPRLYRHSSGTYYARVALGGKDETFRSLKTKVLSIAVTEQAKLQGEADQRAELSRDIVVSEHMTGGEALAIRQKQYQNNPRIKKTTKHYLDQIGLALKRSWPELEATELRKVTVTECEEWSGRYAAEVSAPRYNATLSMLRSLFDIAVERGARRINPAAKLKRMRVKFKDLSSKLPSRAKFTDWVNTIRSAGGRFSIDCADFVEFLAYTGVRIGEAAWIRWQHCDFKRGEILVTGNPEDGTKNHEPRRVPMVAAVQTLLKRLKEESPNAEPTERVLKVTMAKKAMDRAIKLAKIARITHHDLRHFFATICIESGVDIPTVSKWLGHKDGGALAMKVYGHLRNEHSLAAATRVSFAA
jgi:integrase